MCTNKVGHFLVGEIKLHLLLQTQCTGAYVLFANELVKLTPGNNPVNKTSLICFLLTWLSPKVNNLNLWKPINVIKILELKM